MVNFCSFRSQTIGESNKIPCSLLICSLFLLSSPAVYPLRGAVFRMYRADQIIVLLCLDPCVVFLDHWNKIWTSRVGQQGPPWSWSPPVHLTHKLIRTSGLWRWWILCGQLLPRWCWFAPFGSLLRWHLPGEASLDHTFPSSLLVFPPLCTL